MTNINKFIMNKVVNEQLIRGDSQSITISSIIIKSIEESDRSINEIPKLKYYKIKERILESYIKTIK